MKRTDQVSKKRSVKNRNNNITAYIIYMSKRKHSKRKQTTKPLWNNPPRIPINQNSAFLFANAPNRPYIPLTTFIASPYNNGVVPDEYKVISTRLETLEKMNQSLQHELNNNTINQTHLKDLLNYNIVSQKQLNATKNTLIQSQKREMELDKQARQHEKRANELDDELQNIRGLMSSSKLKVNLDW